MVLSPALLLRVVSAAPLALLVVLVLGPPAVAALFVEAEELGLVDLGVAVSVVLLPRAAAGGGRAGLSLVCGRSFNGDRGRSRALST